MAATKELKVRSVSNGMPMYEVYYEGGGEIPDVLKTLYTSVLIANQAIEKFQASVRTKVKGNTRGKSTSN